MPFILGVIFFVCVVGVIDARLPWPKPRPVVHADYTHSLVGALFLSAVLGIAFGTRWGQRTGVVLGFVSFSRWLLDLVVHRHDMPVLPGDAGHLPKLGFGLWQFPWAAVSAEVALVSAGAWFYWRTARSVSIAASVPQRRAAVVSLMILMGGLLVLALDVSGILG